jgi:hypothetical protein
VIYDPATLSWTEVKGTDGLEYECVEFVRRFYRVVKGCNQNSPCNTANWWGNADSYFGSAGQFGLERHYNGADSDMPAPGDIVGYEDILNTGGHVAVIKKIVPTTQPYTWLVYVIEQNVIPFATTLPLLLTQNPSTNFYTLTDSVPNGTGVPFGYPVGWKSRIGVQYSIQGWMRVPTVTPVTTWNSFLEGNPGVPGDGIVVAPDIAANPLVPQFFLAQPVALNAAGLTVTIFPAITVGTGAAALGIELSATGSSTACQVAINTAYSLGFGNNGALAFGYGGIVTFNGVEGNAVTITSLGVQALVNAANIANPACHFSDSQLEISGIYLVNSSSSPPTFLKISLDAMAIGLGFNAYPGTLITFF